MPYSKIHCKSVDDFWSLLDPTNPLGKGLANSEKFVFRGQIDANDWNLKPSAYRKISNPSFLIENENNPTSDMQIFNEWNILKNFVEQCDITGIRVPRETHSDRSDLFEEANFMKKYMSNPRSWPGEEYYEILAFAQHHGLPTCLLDWTKRSHIAAYFAASLSTTIKENFNNLVVWVLNTSIFQTKVVEKIELPTSISVNLSAQFGLFTLSHPNMAVGQIFIPENFEDTVNEKYLTKITLAKEYASKILKYCDLHAVSAATLFPGVDGAVKATKEKLSLVNRQDEYQSIPNDQLEEEDTLSVPLGREDDQINY